MEGLKNIGTILGAVPITNDDLLAVFQPNVLNIITQRPGDTRKITVADFVNYVNGKQQPIFNSHADEVEGYGRNLFDVLGVSTIPAAMAAIRRLCNNNGEIDNSGVPYFTGLRKGDYLDGMNLSAIPAENGGDAGQAWNGTYLNNRIVISGFNTYKHSGSTETVKNHVLFTFRNFPIRKRLNPTNNNAGGYHDTELRAFLDGKNGDGTGNYTGASSVTTGAFLAALRAQLGGDYVLKIRRLLDCSTYEGAENWAWQWYSVFLPTENELFGASIWGRPGYGDGLKLHIPIYEKSSVFRVKRYNGTRQAHWLATPHAASSTIFVACLSSGGTGNDYASTVNGCAPAFCVA